MADMIIVATDIYEQCVRKLKAIQDDLSSTANRIAAIDLSRDQGGDVQISLYTKLKNGTSIKGPTAYELLFSIMKALTATGDDAERLAAAIRRSFSEFETTEDEIRDTFLRVSVGDDGEKLLNDYVIPDRLQYFR